MIDLENGELNNAKGVKLGFETHSRLTEIRERIRQRQGIPSSYDDAVKYLLDFYKTYYPTVQKLRLKDLIIE